jgi:hypothetical protein
MVRRTKGIPVKLDVKYVPLPTERVGAWRAGMILLLQLLREKCVSEISNQVHVALELVE